MTVSLSFSSITTPMVRKLIVAHRKATGRGNSSNGVKPRVAVEGPEAWSLDTEKLYPDEMVAFLSYASEYPELRHLFPAQPALADEFDLVIPDNAEGLDLS